MARPKGTAGKEVAVSAAENKAAGNSAAGAAKSDANTTKEEIFSKSQVDELIRAAVQEALSSKKEETKEEGYVTLIYLAEVSPENLLTLPSYGSLRPGSVLTVKKSEWGGKFMSPLAVKLLRRRHLIVASGLDYEERERWGVNYKEGEVLDARAFDKLLDMDKGALCDMFSRLCPEHQRFVVRRFITAFETHDNRVSVDKARALNDLCRNGENEGILTPVLKAMGEELLK